MRLNFGLTNLAGNKKWLVRPAIVLAVLAVPAGTALALTSSDSSGEPSAKNDRQVKLQINQKNADSSDNQPLPSAKPIQATSETSPDTGKSGAVSSHSVSVSTNVSNDRAEVKVNGKKVRLPENGSVHKTIKSDGSKTNLDVSVNRGGSSAGSSINLDVSSESTSVSN